MEIRIKTGQYQDLFLSSGSKFPALIAGVGTGKTLCLLTKAYKYAEDYPGSSLLIVRKEFTDLKDSTIKDFQRYFGVSVGVDKNYRLPNGSLVMFRHGSELNNLKNLNLSFVGVEQAEEFETDEQFHMLRDRLRQDNGADCRPLCLIANANGHNWIWNLFINGADCTTIDERTGQFQYIKNHHYVCITANSFANESNLPAEFIADLRLKEKEAPRQYQQFVMNSFEDLIDDDYVFSFADLQTARQREFAHRPNYGYRIFGYDIARYGNDKCAAVGIEQIGALAWRVCYVEQWEHKDLDYTTGRILSTSNTNHADNSVIDEDGIGSAPLDTISKGQKREDFIGFRNPVLSPDKNRDYCNPRTEAAFKAREYVAKGWMQIKDEALIQELMTLRYRYANDGRRILISKEEMRKQGVKSPNMADAFLMACSLIGRVREQQDNQYRHHSHASQSKEDNLFQLAGVR